MRIPVIYDDCIRYISDMKKRTKSHRKRCAENESGHTGNLNSNKARPRKGQTGQKPNLPFHMLEKQSYLEEQNQEIQEKDFSS